MFNILSTVKPSRRRFVKGAAASPFVIQASAGGILALGFGVASQDAAAQGQARERISAGNPQRLAGNAD